MFEDEEDAETPQPTAVENSHSHINESGKLIKCYHNCKTVFCDLGFWVGLTIGFPIEHLLWEKFPPFNIITKWLGL